MLIAIFDSHTAHTIDCGWIEWIVPPADAKMEQESSTNIFICFAQ